MTRQRKKTKAWPAPKKGNKRWKAKLFLLFITILFCLAFSEALIRNFYPRYQYAAESQYRQDNMRIWSRKKNQHSKRVHPDTGLSHPVFYNNLALRQNRDFTKADLATATNVAFFGDSFTENLRLPSQYSFTDVLDNLINDRGKPFNVLNFGVSGYGTDQAYLYYRDFEFKDDLHYVFYVLCRNDFRNIYENNLYTLDRIHRLIRKPGAESPWWIKLVSSYHLTYLIMDAWQKLFSTSGRNVAGFVDHQESEERKAQRRKHSERSHSPTADAIQDRIISGNRDQITDDVMTIFSMILKKWKTEVEETGAKFYVVLLPRVDEHGMVDLIKEDYNVIDLYELFSEKFKNYEYKDISFRNDGHWNEKGNRLAAIELNRVVAEAEDLPPLDGEELAKKLLTYYSAFPNGWMPDGLLADKEIPVHELTKIRNRYLELENLFNPDKYEKYKRSR